jgi:(p)ppGpp synthase/HD superfamily hydrolase
MNLGKSNLEHELTKAVFDEHLKSGEFERIAKMMNYQSADDLFAALGYGETTLNKIVNKIKKPQIKQVDVSFGQEGKKRKNEKDIIGLEGLLYSIAKCCSPIPGEPIVGVVTRSKGVTVHRIDCNSLESIPPERYMDIQWAGENTNKTYSTTIRVETMDKIGLLKDIIAAVSDNNTNINFANVKAKNNKVGIIELGIELDNITTLKRVITAIQALPDVYSVKRVQTPSTSFSAPQKGKRQKQQKNQKPKSNK